MYMPTMMAQAAVKILNSLNLFLIDLRELVFD
jgi:hypothetical protein